MFPMEMIPLFCFQLDMIYSLEYHHFKKPEMYVLRTPYTPEN